MGHDHLLLTDCFEDFGGVKEFNLCGNIIKVQPASNVPHACCSIWQNMDYELEREIKEIGPSVSIYDIFPKLTQSIDPIYSTITCRKMAVQQWRGVYLVFLAGLDPKSLMVALMMWNGIADSFERHGQ